jgi:hypothetical protein
VVAVIGIYCDRSGTERVEICALSEAREVMNRWRVQRYAGIIEVWVQHSAAGFAAVLCEEEWTR